MIPNHFEFIKAIAERRKVLVRFHSAEDRGILARVCAPLSYGLGDEVRNRLNQYWFWDYAANNGTRTLGLGALRIIALQVLDEIFDPAQLGIRSLPRSVPGNSTDSYNHWGINE